MVRVSINKLDIMRDIKDFQLLEYNTFGIEGKCKRFCEFDSIEEFASHFFHLTIGATMSHFFLQGIIEPADN